MIPQQGKTTHEVPAPPGDGQLVLANTSQQQVQDVPKRQAAWLQSTASVALLACAAYGIGTILTPYAKMCWKYFRSEDDETEGDTKSQLIQLNKLFAKYTTKQDEKLDEVSKAAASAVKEIKVRHTRRRVEVCSTATDAWNVLRCRLTDVQAFVQACPLCQHINQTPYPWVQTYPLPAPPWTCRHARDIQLRKLVNNAEHRIELMSSVSKASDSIQRHLLVGTGWIQLHLWLRGLVNTLTHRAGLHERLHISRLAWLVIVLTHSL